jgi:tetratricopeptide (TPR) repeat protein
MMKLRLRAMSIAIAAGVGVFLAAQELRLIPNAWSEEASQDATASYATYHPGSDATPYSAAVAAHPDDYMSYYRRGLHYQARGNLDLALKDLDRAVALSPHPMTRAMLGDEMHDSSSRDTRTLNRVVFVRLVRATVLSQLAREPEALADLNRAIALDDHKTSAIFARAALLTGMERFDEAIADYDRLLARYTETDWVFGRGVAKFHSGDFDGASRDFREAARREPSDEIFQAWLEKASLRASVAAQVE